MFLLKYLKLFYILNKNNKILLRNGDKAYMNANGDVDYMKFTNIISNIFEINLEN